MTQPNLRPIPAMSITPRRTVKDAFSTGRCQAYSQDGLPALSQNFLFLLPQAWRPAAASTVQDAGRYRAAVCSYRVAMRLAVPDGHADRE